jgi:hypothetical protein
LKNFDGALILYRLPVDIWAIRPAIQIPIMEDRPLPIRHVATIPNLYLIQIPNSLTQSRT